MRSWIDREQVGAGERPGGTSVASVELEALRKENVELRRANEMLRTVALSPRRRSTADSGDLLLHRRPPTHVRVAPIHWFSTARLHSALDQKPPVDSEQHYRSITDPQPPAWPEPSLQRIQDGSRIAPSARRLTLYLPKHELPATH